jgi:hypothetical protein
MNKGKSFFVGYLPMPADLKKFTIIIAVVLLVATTVLSTMFSRQQSLSGKGIIDTSGTVTIEGLLTVDPYPVLHVAGNEPKSVILVLIGKHSADDIALPHANTLVSVTGSSINRGGWSMLEISGSESIEKNPEGKLVTVPEAQALGEVTMRGEIVDSKCFLGVMKPGPGKIHRACAALCLLGGIPPMFVIRDPEGQKFGYLLTDSTGRSSSKQLSPMVATPVKVNGTLEKRGDLTYLKLSDDQGSPELLTGVELLQYGETLAVNAEKTAESCGVMAMTNTDIDS